MHDCKSPAGIFTRGAFLCLLILSGTVARADFFITRNQNPFTLFQGQPLPLPAQAATPNWHAQLSLDIANTLNVPANSNQSLFVDFESYNFNARIDKALNANWSFTLDIPLIHRGGGIFDNAIDSWHRAFGLPRADRPNVSDNQFSIRYINNGVTLVDINQPTSELGDIALHLGYHFLSEANNQLALWLSAELPTGNMQALSGNDSTDYSMTLAASLQPADAWQLDANLGLVMPGANLFDANPTTSTVLYAYLAGNWRALDWLQLGMQLEMHQSYFRDDSLDLLGNATVLVFGGTIIFDSCNKLHIGVSEDIDVGASPDISLLISWQYQSCDRH